MNNISKVMDILLKTYVSHRQPTIRRTSKTESPFKVLITCLLSLRTQDKNTEIASSRLFEHIKTPQDIVKINIKKLEKLIYSSGHYKKKSRVLKSVSKELIERFNSKVPSNKEDLLSIKGIGPKTANIVLSFAYGQEVLPIDVHCHRIPNRLGWVKTKTPEQTELELMKILPRKYWMEFNTTIILFGKSICVPISPKCSICPVRKYCKRVGVIKSR
ncbi:MAG: endonuclease III [Candidatus Nanoarchaeia archaeon]|nr:endonuclease III [Candidatus Nanoarchaeia archaeon]MDD5588011.1 endonuclease III [Candidatus Nanoarchaeia archaeon]